jgi:hypothetical protein
MCSGQQEEYKRHGVNIARSCRTADQQEAVYAKKFEQERVLAKARDRSASSKGPMRKVGQIPREAWIARTRQHGKEYWTNDDPKELAKRDGFLF